jgi:hypothetical protein
VPLIIWYILILLWHRLMVLATGRASPPDAGASRDRDGDATPRRRQYTRCGLPMTLLA